MTTPASRQLFVYSSLRKGFHKSAYHYVSKFFSFACLAKVSGMIHEAAEGPFATIGDGKSFIDGELYVLNDEHDFSYVFGQLDDYEGLIIEQGEKPLYRRAITRVTKDNGDVTDAWIYWYNDDVQDKPGISPGNAVASNC
ncbi:MAG: gamma-glutamylcyclotransferase family protein [Ginsengibacter sp.]